jgi:GNAT superfamily N-acetyltransferase
VAQERGQVTGLCYGGLGTRPAAARRGFIDLIAVAPGARGRGTGKQLLSAAEDRLRSAGASEIMLGGDSPVYAWPGVDPRYTAMTCLAERAGYRRVRDAVNMIVDLGAAWLDTAADDRLLAAAGITARRANPAEADAVAGWLRQGPWGNSGWPQEAARAIAADPPGCHVAVRDGHYLGFACHGVNRRGWFGPTGTLPREQGHGIGTALMRRCLVDIAAAGHTCAQLGWVGPVRFYARAVAARIDRVFWLYQKTT